LICAGGTGGGVYPALSVLKALGTEAQPVLWVGGEGGIEAGLVTRSQVPFTAIPAAGVHGVGLRALPGNLWRLAKGTLAAQRILKEFRPDAILFTGGYVAAPMALAARRYPSLVFCPDIEPGLALKFLARFADVIAITTPTSANYFPSGKQIVTTGYPLRPEMAGWTRAAGQAHFGLDTGSPVLLVTGGSKGAQTINRAVLSCLPALLQKAQVLHISGSVDWPEAQAAQSRLPASLAGRYHAHEFLHEDMGAALAAADLAISRAGASTLAEYPLFGLPAILVPYPFAWRYQKVNASYLQDQGAAVLLPDEDMPARLLPLVQDLLSQPQRLEAMRQAMRGLARPRAAEEIANLLQRIASRPRGGNS
jgi:UDP-N-acetylglucosamine--N-acetylmuramyl-(pentapeptide) pyrophosphoryl-undecaprenol N-acetylglucosamine transferase